MISSWGLMVGSERGGSSRIRVSVVVVKVWFLILRFWCDICVVVCVNRFVGMVERERGGGEEGWGLGEEWSGWEEVGEEWRGGRGAVGAWRGGPGEWGVGVGVGSADEWACTVGCDVDSPFPFGLSSSVSGFLSHLAEYAESKMTAYQEYNICS